jgi:putative membrane protein
MILRDLGPWPRVVRARIVALMMFGWGAGWGVGSWLLMGIGIVLFWGVVVTLVIVLARRSRDGAGRSGGLTHPTSALDILAERFARGEIDEEEYDLRRRALLGERP